MVPDPNSLSLGSDELGGDVHRDIGPKCGGGGLELRYEPIPPRAILAPLHSQSYLDCLSYKRARRHRKFLGLKASAWHTSNIHNRKVINSDLLATAKIPLVWMAIKLARNTGFTRPRS